MAKRTDNPKVFVSYSWSSVSHENWVKELAERLMSDGVTVILDKWDLKEGQDKYVFMEKMVSDPDIYRVLIICDKPYMLKANERKGGAGTESQIISSEIYSKLDQEKFIPVVREFEDEKPCLPTYLKSRIYIDLSSESGLHDEYEKLLRNIYKRPALKKPPLGNPPDYLLEDEPTRIITTHKANNFRDAFLQEKKTAKAIFSDYLDTLVDGIKQQIFDVASGEVDDFVVKAIHQILPYRDEFIAIIVFLTRNNEDSDYYIRIHKFLTQFLSLTESKDYSRAPAFDHIRFFQYEFFVYLIASLIEARRTSALDIFLDEDYYFINHQRQRFTTFQSFNQRIESLDDVRNRRLNLSRVSIQADLLIERANNKLVNMDLFIQADLVLFLRSVLNPREGLSYWYPRTIIYARQAAIPFELFFKARRVRDYEFVKNLLKFKSIEEFIEKFNKSNHEKILGKSYYSLPVTIDELLNIKELYEIYKKR